MKNNIVTYVVWGCMLFSIPHTVNAQENDTVQFHTGGGVVISPEFSDVLEDAYPEYSFSQDELGILDFGWLSIGCGVRFQISEKVSIGPAVNFMANVSRYNKPVTSTVNFRNGTRTMEYESPETSFNTITLPAISGRYYFKECHGYVRAEINYGIPTASGDIDVESNGIGYGIAVGIKGMELGYLHIPVKVNNSEDGNFGGFFLMFTH